MYYKNRYAFLVKINSKREGLRIVGTLSDTGKLRLVSYTPYKEDKTVLYEVETAYPLAYFKGLLTRHKIEPEGEIVVLSRGAPQFF